MLEELRDDSYRMFLCTAKRRDFTERILQQLDLNSFFEAIYADSVDMVSHNKTDLLRTLLVEQREAPKGMIGDRIFDVEAGRACGIRTITVSYGYGSPEEFAPCNPDIVCHSPGKVLAAVRADRA